MQLESKFAWHCARVSSISLLISAVASFVRIPTNALLRFDFSIRTLLGFHLFPPQLKKAIAKFEKLSVPVECSVLLLETKKDEKRACLFIQCANPVLLLERIVASARIAGKHLDSIKVSSHDNSILIAWGLDRGGGDTYLGVRSANREGGNQADFCFPLGMIEHASEEQGNLKQTFFAKDSPIKATIQSLSDVAMHSIDVVVKHYAEDLENNTSAPRIDAQSVFVMFTPSNDPPENTYLSHKKTQRVALEKLADLVFQEGSSAEDPLSVAIAAKDRALATKVVIPSLTYPLDENTRIWLQIQMIRSESDGFVGFILFHHAVHGSLDEVFRVEFERPMEYSPDITVECSVVRGFPANDMKCAVLITGQCSCGITTN